MTIYNYKGMKLVTLDEVRDELHEALENLENDCLFGGDDVVLQGEVYDIIDDLGGWDCDHEEIRTESPVNEASWKVPTETFLHFEDGTPLYIQCTHCDCMVMRKRFELKGNAKWNFCPNCGYKMPEERVDFE